MIVRYILTHKDWSMLTVQFVVLHLILPAFFPRETSTSGPAAVTTILKGAVKIPPRTQGFTNYVKQGTATSAYREFLAVVCPENILKCKRKYGQARLYRGEADNRILYYTPRDQRAGNKPTITIYDPIRSTTGGLENAAYKIIYE